MHHTHAQSFKIIICNKFVRYILVLHIYTQYSIAILTPALYTIQLTNLNYYISDL